MVNGDIFKLYEWGKVKISNMDIEAYSAHYEPILGNNSNPNVELVTYPNIQYSIMCDDRGSYTHSYQSGDRRKVVTKTILRRASGFHLFLGLPNQYVSKTMYYKKTFYGWGTRNYYLTAGIKGKTFHNECNYKPKDLNERSSVYNYRSVQRYALNQSSNMARINFVAPDNMIGSIHYLGAQEHKRIYEYFDGNALPLSFDN